MVELEVNRSNHLIDPQLQIWGWEIPVYLFLGGLTAGLMIFSALLAWRVPEGERSRWSRWLPLGAPIVLSLGMLALLLDVELKRHVFRFYTALMVTSPMSWGSWILVAIYPATILLGLGQLTDDEARALCSWRPVRALRLDGLCRWIRGKSAGALPGLRWANLVLGVALGGYTGVLLGTLGARPVWSSAILGPLFLVSGLSTGAALTMLFPVSRQEHRLLRRWDLGAIGVELVLVGLFLLGLATGGGASQQAAALFLGGPYTAAFWSLVVIAGLVTPLVIEIAEGVRGLRNSGPRAASRRSGMKQRNSVAAPLFLLVGGLSLRWILVAAGQA